MTLSVMGLYHYDNSLFNTMALPEAVDRSSLIAMILMDCSELEVFLPDPEIMKEALAFWSKTRLPVWKKLYETTQYEYNPIWNKDGTFTETRNLATGANSTSTGSVAAFNSSTFQNETKQESNASGTDTGTIIRKEQGNIGVTSTQELIQRERDVVQFDIYKFIADEFRMRFCIGVY